MMSTVSLYCSTFASFKVCPPTAPSIEGLKTSSVTHLPRTPRVHILFVHTATRTPQRFIKDSRTTLPAAAQGHKATSPFNFHFRPPPSALSALSAQPQPPFSSSSLQHPRVPARPVLSDISSCVPPIPRQHPPATPSTPSTLIEPPPESLQAMSDADSFHAEEDYDDPLGAYIPASFGKRTKETDIEAQLERARRPAAAKSPPQPPKDEDGDEDDDDDDDDDADDDEDDFPVSHEMILKTHERAVTTVSLDPAGTRLISGSLDGTVKLHDLSSMTPTTLRAFKTVDPYQGKPSANSEQFPICHVEFSPTSGGAVLCIGDHPQPKILSRDGDVLTEFVKGDMYLRDQHHTKGHTAAATTGAWHPTDRNLCVSASTDSTLRIWDINQKRSQKDIIVVKSKTAGNAGRTRMTAVAWGSPASGGQPVLVAAALDGSLVMYSGTGPFTRPTAEIRDAHKPETWTGGVDISADGRMVVTRGGDGMVKLWDTRNFKKPLVTREHPSSSDQFPTSTIKYSPNSTNILTGSPTGDLCILNPGNLSPELTTPVTPGSPLVAVEWHPKINQIVTGSANAETRVLFSPDKSSRGALEVMSKAPKKRHVDDNPAFTTDQTFGISGDSIIVPGSGQHSKRGARGGAGGGGSTAGVTQTGRSKDPRRPHVPQQTPFQRSQPDEKHISKNIPLSKMLHEDPREALLKYADKATKDPQFTAAWKSTQPVTEYADISDDEDGPQQKKAKR